MLTTQIIDKSLSNESLESKRLPVLKASREFRNSQTLQQSILLGLLNKYCSITISQPAKKSTVTGQFMRIISINFGNGDEIQIDDFLKKRCIEQMQKDIYEGVSEKTALRRYQNNKKIEQIHLMMDILSEKGYQFTTKKMKGKLETKKLEMFSSIQYEGKVFSVDDLAFQADYVHHLISEKLNSKNRKIVLERYTIMNESFVL